MNRPYIVEFSGMPKSGKSTILDIVAQYFRRIGYTVLVHPDLGGYSSIGKTEIGALNIHLACQAVSFLTEKRYGKSGNSEIILVDRGIFDRCVFAEVLKKDKKISAEEAKAISAFLTCKSISSITDRVFVFLTDVDLSLKRGTEYSLVDLPGTILNRTSLAKFKNHYLRLVKAYSGSFAGIEIVNTRDLDRRIRDTARQVVIKIEEDLVDRNLNRSAEFDVLFRDEFAIVASALPDKILPYVISVDGIKYYRCMNKIYIRKQVQYLSHDEINKLCGLRLKYFDHVVDEAFNKNMTYEVADLITGLMKSGGTIKVLDFGCGSGLSSYHLFEKLPNARLTGVDISDNAVRLACERGLDVVKVDDGAPFPFEEGEFDFVVAIFVMHLNVPLYYLKEIARVLKKGGLFIFNVYNRDSCELNEVLERAGLRLQFERTIRYARDQHRIWVVAHRQACI